MKKLTLLTLILLLNNYFGYAQVEPPFNPIDNLAFNNLDVGFNNPRTSSDLFVLTTSITDLRVEVLVNAGLSSPTLYWRRTNAGVLVTGTDNLNSNQSIRNLDVKIGNGGNNLLVVYQQEKAIKFKIYQWNGLDYALLNSGNVASHSSTLFGVPRLAVDDQDNVVVIFHSYSNSNFSSPQTTIYLKKGDIYGNWTSTVGNSFGAYPLINHVLGISLTASVNTSETFSDIRFVTDPTNLSTSTPIATFTRINSAGNEELYISQVATSDIINNTNGSLLSNLLYSTSEDLTVPSLASNWYSNGSSYKDWLLATTVVNTNGTSSLLTVGGSYNLLNLTPINLLSFTIPTNSILNCDNRNVDIAYVNDYAILVWEHTDCNQNNPNLLDKDILYCIIDWSNGLPSDNIVRRLSGNHYEVDQIFPTISGSVGTSPFVAFYDSGSNQFYFKNTSSLKNDQSLSTTPDIEFKISSNDFCVFLKPSNTLNGTDQNEVKSIRIINLLGVQVLRTSGNCLDLSNHNLDNKVSIVEVEITQNETTYHLRKKIFLP